MKAAILVTIALVLVLSCTAFAGSAQIVGTKHNLSVAGLFSVKALAENQICIFCHTPHNANPHYTKQDYWAGCKNPTGDGTYYNPIHTILM